MIGGYVVLVGQGYPARDDDPDGNLDIITFATEVDAQRWIDEHPRAQSPSIAALKGAVS